MISATAESCTVSQCRPGKKSTVILAAAAPLLPLFVSFSKRSTSYCWKQKLTVRIRASRGFVFLFLECGGETVKGVRKVSESVSTEPVVFFCTRCTTRFPASHCLLLTPFRYCSYLLPPLFSFSLTLSLSLFQLLSFLVQISPCFSSIWSTQSVPIW